MTSASRNNNNNNNNEEDDDNSHNDTNNNNNDNDVVIVFCSSPNNVETRIEAVRTTYDTLRVHSLFNCHFRTPLVFHHTIKVKTNGNENEYSVIRYVTSPSILSPT